MTQQNETVSQENNLSPALAQMMAMILMPRQYEAVVANAMLSINSKCPATVRMIAK